MFDPSRRIRALRALVVAVALIAAALAAPSASAGPAVVSGCQTLGAPGAYALTADIAVVESTCIEITANDVKLDLARHTISCTRLHPHAKRGPLKRSRSLLPAGRDHAGVREHRQHGRQQRFLADFGIRTGFGNGIGPQTSGNHILNNVAKGNPLADLSQVDGENSWNDNKRCNTEHGTVPATVCDPSE